ncbi:MAG: HD domain-containing protein [Candidatus Marsarchaeota archaeon]|nr:HD domain-containing protein [Candidatus Marsarchaeota archaeon]
MYIRDPVLQEIHATSDEERIIDTNEFQRLRRVSQLGFANLVYPGATGTRFEHSLGTMRITKDLSINLYGKIDPELSVAGLLHDVGHTPYSHATEPVFMHRLRKTHEQLGRDMIMAGPLHDAIQDSSLSLKKVLSGFDGNGKGTIITGPLGSDRLDYLMRDAYQTGVAYGIIDYVRIKNRLAYRNGKPAIYLNGVDGAESMLIARYYMLSSVYFHHTSVIASSMFNKALDACISSGEIDPKEAARFEDLRLSEALLHSKSGSKLAKDVEERKLFKRAYYIDSLDVDLKKGELESALGHAGLDYNDYVVEINHFKGGHDDIMVIDKDGSRMGLLSKISPLFNALLGMLSRRSIVLAACEPVNVARARIALRKAL